MKILAIDYGDNRTGFAISDATQTLARELSIESTDDNLIFYIQKVVKENNIENILVGKPVNISSGADTQQTKKVIEFFENLKSKIECSIEFYDERFSSKMVHASLKNFKKKPKHIDAMAACIFLQEYLNRE